jgi:lipopolysaccharide transport system permease protein
MLDLISILTHKDLKVRYKSSMLGYLWSIANPLAFAFVFYIAFKVIMKIQMEGYALFLIAGLFPWQWFANSVTVTPTVFLANASIIKKVNFSRNILPFTIVLQDMLHFILSIPVIVLFMFIYHKTPGWIWLVGIPVLLIIQFIMAYGIALAISSINLFFRDLERLTALGVTLLFYFTPIFYPETMIPVKYQQLINFNPLTPLIISWRNLFLHNQLDGMYLAISLGYGLVFLGIGFWIYRKLAWKFAEVL